MESLGKLVVNNMNSKKKHPKVYGVYKGDKFIDVGTADEICRNQGWTRRYFTLLKTPSRQNAPNKGNRLEIFELDEE